MKRLAIGVIVGLLVGATGAPADDERQAIVERHNVSHYSRNMALNLIPAVSPPGENMRVTSVRCGARFCRVRIVGRTTLCRGAVAFTNNEVSYWFRWLRCS